MGCLAGSSKTVPTILIFSFIFFEAKNNEIWVPVVFKHNNSFVATVNKQSTDLPEWFTKMDKNQGEFIQEKELNSDY